MATGQFKDQLKTQPLAVTRSRRTELKRILTSGFAGKIIPVAYMPMLREDALTRSRMRIAFEMSETPELLANGVNVEVNAYFIPYLAFERFNGMDSLNRSYSGVPEKDGEVIPFIETQPFGVIGSNEIYTALGLHGREGLQVNTSVLEAYNVMVNFRRRQRSKSLTERDRYNTTLAEAFWKHTQMAGIVPDFDQAMIDGEVPLNVVAADLPLRGFGVEPSAAYGAAGISHEAGGVISPDTGNKNINRSDGTGGASSSIYINEDPNNPGFPDLFAEMAENGITVSLSNIDMARKTAAFARLRADYRGHDDEYIIDMLMDGIHVPEAMLKQPILLAKSSTSFGYHRRFATDSGNLDQSATNGQSFVDLNIRIPQMNTGGIVMITAEITPEQLFERQEDHFFTTKEVSEFPAYIRDFLDPEKVAIVQNQHVDMDHSDPAAPFGYTSSNFEWLRTAPNVGGKYYRPEVDDPDNENRQKIWAVETPDPELTKDFYLCTDMHHNVFADRLSDPFEIQASGEFVFTGNTFFGPRLREASDDYETIMAQIDHDRIDKPAETEEQTET